MDTLIEIIANQTIPSLQEAQAILYPKGGEASGADGEKHNYWELCFLSEGKCSFYLEGKKFELEPNSLVLLPPGTPHSEAWQESDPYRLLWLGLRPDTPPNAFLSRRYQITDGARVQGEADYLSLLEQAFSELEGEEFCYLQAAASQLTLFFVAILRGLKAGPASALSWQKQVVEAVQKYLAANFKEQITLDEISNQVGLSPNYLCALFREQTEETIFEHLAGLRLKRARFLLRNTQLPIYAIADQVGYSSQFAFSRFFHKAMGLSPTGYREKEGGIICASGN